MTILPKKKQNQGKNEAEVGDNPAHHGGHMPQPSVNDSREAIYSGRNSPPRWQHTPRDDKRTSQGPSYEESGPSHNKRRARASPHRGNGLRGNKHRAIPSPPLQPAISQASSSIPVSAPVPADDNTKATNSDKEYSGYNSGDEYGQPSQFWTEEEWTEKERLFEKKLRKKGLYIKKMGEDGACLFRAVADQVFGDEEMHPVVRQHCMDYMAKNSDYFSQYVTEDFDKYLRRKRMDTTHGNHIEMQSMTEIYSRSIEVYHYGSEPINIFHGVLQSDNEPIRISYHKNIHYNSIVDPNKATVGVGLGLPDLVPGLADKNLLRDATRQSEECHIEQAMLEDKIKATDWEATNEAIEEQVARESYLQWLRDTEKRAKKARTATATSSCSTVTSSGGRSPRSRGSTSANNSPAVPEHHDDLVNPPNTESGSLPGSSKETSGHSGARHEPPYEMTFQETASFISNIGPEMFGLEAWDDEDILARVLAASQEEYLQSLKRTCPSHSSAGAGCSGTSGSGSSSSSYNCTDVKPSDPTNSNPGTSSNKF